MKLKKAHLEILHHTVYRASCQMFCGDSPEMQELVDAGLMRCLGHKSCVPDPYFGITREGKLALGLAVVVEPICLEDTE